MEETVVIDNMAYALLPGPTRPGYTPALLDPQITFSAGRYTERRPAYPTAKWSYVYDMGLITEADKNTLVATLKALRCTAFYFCVPESLYPRPDGTYVPEWRIVQVTSEKTEIVPVAYGLYRAQITMEEV